MIFDVERACVIDSSIGEWWLLFHSRSGGGGASYGLPSSFRHVMHLYRNFLTNCLPCTIQNLAISSVRVDLTPPCMTRLWFSRMIRDVMRWPLSNKIGCFIQVGNSALVICEDIKLLSPNFKLGTLYFLNP